MHRRVLPVLGVLLFAGCGYFNSLYNANRSYAAAERASRAGDRATAVREYRAAIDRAAVSYRKYPDSRWADDALLLLGRARFALGEHEAAAAAMRTLLARPAGVELRPLAHGWLGAALVAQGEPDAAMLHLDSAAARLPASSDDGAFVRLWRARAAFETGRSAAAWTDLEAAAVNRFTVREAAFVGVQHAVIARDTTRVRNYLGLLSSARFEPALLPRVDSLVRAVARDWSPAIALHASAPLQQADWPAAARDNVTLLRSQVAMEADSVDTALELAMRVATASSAGSGSRARYVAARIRLGPATHEDDLEDIRTLLLPAYDDPGALELMRQVRAAQILLNAGRDPQSALSLFAAAEFLRDELGARQLARRTFLDFARAQEQSPWAGKAVLAAHLLASDTESTQALDRLAANPYVRMVRGDGSASADVDRAEERLAFAINGLRADAIAEAVRRDAVVGRAVAVLDSTRALARNDSIRISCGAMIDTLAIRGIRADSTRSACLRGDTARVRFVLAADTAILVEAPENADPRTVRGRRPVPDTTTH